MRTRLIATGVLGTLALGVFIWFAAMLAAKGAMAQEQRAAAQAAQAQAEAQAQAAAQADAAARQAEIKAQAAAIKAQAAAQPADASQEANNAATKERLAERMEATFLQQTVADVLEFLADQLNVEVHLQRGEIEGAGLSLDAPVSLRFKRVRGDMLLDLALQQVSPDLSYIIRDGIVIVGNRGSLSGSQVVRVYNCRDLLAAAAESPPTPAGPMGIGFPPGTIPGTPQPGGSRPPGGVPGMAGAMGGYFAGGSGGSPATPTEQLQRVIRTTVAPESWDLNGGAGSMEEFGGLLVVNQSEAIHDRVEKLLQMLREAAVKK